MNTMLEREFQYFLDHKAELLENYEGKFVVIQKDTVVGVYDTEIEAYTESQKKYELGSFLIQPCTKDASSQSQTYHSRVLFK